MVVFLLPLPLFTTSKAAGTLLPKANDPQRTNVERSVANEVPQKSNVHQTKIYTK